MPRYSKTVIFLDWSMTLLILAAWLTAEGARQIRLNPPLLHFSLGLAVLLLCYQGRPRDGVSAIPH
jgi:superoxide oxidase